MSVDILGYAARRGMDVQSLGGEGGHSKLSGRGAKAEVGLVKPLGLYSGLIAEVTFPHENTSLAQDNCVDVGIR